MDDENIISEESFLKGFDFDVLEASQDEGQTRTNDADTQSETLIDRGSHSKYKVQARLKTRIHGILDAASKTRASLIVIEYFVSNIEEEGRFSSVTTALDFALQGGGNILNTPNVMAYAPFIKPRRWEKTIGTKDNHRNFEASLEPEVPVVGKLGRLAYTNDRGISHEQQYFTQGMANRNYLKDKDARNIANRVWWNLQHNFSQTSGVPPNFRTAVLVTMPTDAKFTLKCHIEVRGGFGMTLSNLKDTFLRQNLPEMPFVFDPTQQGLKGDRLEGLGPNDQGVYELGQLADDKELVKLTEVWGLDPL
jgi:hypothetical protein